MYKLTLSFEQWKAIDDTASENVNRFAGWIADEHENASKQAWLIGVKRRYELWKLIQKALIDAEIVE